MVRRAFRALRAKRRCPKPERQERETGNGRASSSGPHRGIRNPRCRHLAALPWPAVILPHLLQCACIDRKQRTQASLKLDPTSFLDAVVHKSLAQMKSETEA